MKGDKKVNKIMRPMCICGFRPAAINYKKNNKIYYRKKCEICLGSNGIAKGIPLWKVSGYEKKLRCDKCSFESKHDEQFNVYHVDGNLQNNSFKNLKTICANCQRIMCKEGIKWKQGDLTPDF